MENKDEQLSFSPYEIQEWRRKDKRGGGVAIITHPKLIVTRIQSQNEEFVAIKVKTEDGKEFLVFGIYIPPDWRNESINLTYSEIKDII